MSKTIDAKIILTDKQYEALQVIYRLEAETLDEFINKAVIDTMERHLGEYCPSDSIYERLEAMIKS